jgi:hypothetical protein
LRLAHQFDVLLLLKMSLSAIRSPVLLAFALSLSAVTAFGDLEGMFEGGIDHPAIEYHKRAAKDPVAELNRRIDEGKIQLQFEPGSGYLRSVLRALNVPVESQLLVFSKTNKFARLTNPHNPRAIYFNDSVTVAWVRGLPSLEVATQDPQQGIVFYALNENPVDQMLRIVPGRRARFRRDDSCLACHNGVLTLGVPGMTVRSVFPEHDGKPMGRPDYSPDHRSPLEQRWGGWYVTGKHGPMRHMGNALVTNFDKPESMVTAATLNVESLKGKFDPEGYLSPQSDIVALLVFEHQMYMMNLFTRVGWEIRASSHDEGGKPDADLLRETAEELVDYLLFIDEPPLTDRIQGASGFSEKFAAMGPRDSQGRSLRQFDLEHRLMRYPCSYMIYTEAFDGLPPEAREAIYRRMWQILSGEEKSKKYQRLSLADRRATVEILRETKKGLPAYFTPVTPGRRVRPL